MALSDPTTIKRKVFDLLTASLPDFTVTWGFTKREPPRVWCYLGDTAWPESEWATNRSRQHTMSIPIVLNAIKARTSPEDAEAFLIGKLTAIESAFNADSGLRDTGVISWGLAPRVLGTQPHPDGIEAQGAFDLQVTYRP